MFPEKAGNEKIDKAESTNKNKGSVPKKWTAVVQGLPKHRPYASSPKKVDGAKKNMTPTDLGLSFSQDDFGGDLDSSPSVLKGKCSEDIFPEDVLIEKIDKAEFRDKKTHFVPEKQSSRVQELTKGNSNTSSNKKVDGGNQKLSSVDPMRDKSSSLVKKGKNVEDIEQEFDLGIAGRTRSKLKTIEKPSVADNASRDLSDGSDSSSDKDLEEGYCYNSGETELLLAVSKENKENCNTQEANIALKNASKRSRFSNHQNNESKYKQSPVGIRKESKDDFDHIDGDIQQNIDAAGSDFHGENVKVDVVREIKEPNRSKQVSSKQNNFCRTLAVSVLERGLMLENKEADEEQAKQAPSPPPQTQNTLPLKFTFEDEVQAKVEKTEFEKEMEALFDDLDIDWHLDEPRLSNYLEADEENADAPADETQYARCTRGKHELVVEDDKGLICIYCLHVEAGPKDVMPEWVEKAYQGSNRKQYSKIEQFPEFDGLYSQFSKDKTFADLNNTCDGTVWSLKPGIRESMYQHQQEGFEFLWKNLAGSISLDELKSTDPSGVGGCIISHAPGTGKTRLAIFFIETYLKLFPICRPVIITPASMLLTWEEEFRKWNVEFPFHNICNAELSGKENKAALRLVDVRQRPKKDTIRMIKIYSWNTGRSVLGISYNLFEKMTGEKYIKENANNKRKYGRVNMDDKMKALRKILLEKPGLVVLDEGHTPRNKRSNIWNVLLKVKTEKRVILSGTPFQNNFAELFNTLRIVRPAVADVLAQEKTFSEMRSNHKRENFQSTTATLISDGALEKLKISMSPFVHVHKGTILQQSLPGLRDCAILLKPPPLQKRLIDRLEGSPNGFEFEHKLALVSVHPYLFQHSDLTEQRSIGTDLAAVEASKLNPNEGIKTKFIMELVRLSLVMNEKVVIFSQYIQPLELIKEQLKEIFKWADGKQILQMDGKIEQKQRQILINVFNDPQSEAKVMLGSTKCSSEGISLVGASRVVLLDVLWNPSVERQAISRAYRIGQKKFVYTYHLMTCGTTEADKYCRQAEKERLSELVFSSSSNEISNKKEQTSLNIEDRILEEMVGHPKLKQMFEKIINQPKDTDLIQSFGLTS